ncbi:hypothetical protein E8E12_003837 [Didymella heteroderae]|uniref:Uncharacterized protein n=1 Tax=Didymella heteroderae TaxID=1769908 RepID=A0A9P5BXH5_9PLEO|nr:hypothetical protein E8E12_003837 [Didymella heteroderae]
MLSMSREMIKNYIRIRAKCIDKGGILVAFPWISSRIATSPRTKRIQSRFTSGTFRKRFRSMRYGHAVKADKYFKYVSKYEGEGSGPHDRFAPTYSERWMRVWQTLGSLGGRDRLYTMSYGDFVKAKDKIGRRAQDKLARFQDEADGPELDVLGAETDASGHIAMIAAMRDYFQ